MATVQAYTQTPLPWSVPSTVYTVDRPCEYYIDDTARVYLRGEFRLNLAVAAATWVTLAMMPAEARPGNFQVVPILVYWGSTTYNGLLRFLTTGEVQTYGFTVIPTGKAWTLDNISYMTV